MFCPKCKTENHAGFAICSDCGADLVSRLPAPPRDDPGSYAKPIVIRTYVNRFEAEVAATALDAVGIESMISNKNSEAEFGAPLTRSVRLLVQPEDVDAAEDVLNVAGMDAETAAETAGSTEKA